MKTVLATSSSSNSTTTTAAIEEDERSEARDSCYFPGCRKDANCSCKICLESITATLDLMPFSVQKNSLTKLSASRINVESTPISFNPSILSTPSSGTHRISSFPDLQSPAKLDSNLKVEKRGRNSNSSRWCITLVFVSIFVFAAAAGFFWSIPRIVQPALSADLVRSASKDFEFVEDVNGKLKVLQRELQGMVKEEVSNCSYLNSMWKIDQEAMLLNSRCILYKSATEAVSIWGWPLQTAGLLKSGFSQRSFTILSGRVTEWSGIGYQVRKANTSWVQNKWSASPVQLDPNTWILEYKRSSFLEDSSWIEMAAELCKNWIFKAIKGLEKELWLLGKRTTTHDFKIPT